MLFVYLAFSPEYLIAFPRAEISLKIVRNKRLYLLLNSLKIPNILVKMLEILILREILGTDGCFLPKASAGLGRVYVVTNHTGTTSTSQHKMMTTAVTRQHCNP